MIIKVKYRLYHTAQEGYKHDKEATRFVFCPQYPFRPFGLIIFEPGSSLVQRVIVGNQDQLVAPIAAEHLSSEDLTIELLEQLSKESSMESILASLGIVKMTMPTVNPGTYLTVELTSPVGIVAFWGIEQDV